jgi:hypothetical protein
MNNVNYAKGVIVPHNGELPEDLEYLSNLVRAHCYKHNIHLKRGDVVRFYISDTDANIPTAFDGEEFYRNRDLFMVSDNAGSLVNLATDIDPEGSIPAEFICYEENDYFTRDHWRIKIPRPYVDTSDEKKEDDDGSAEEEEDEYILLLNSIYVTHLAINDAAIEHIKKHGECIYTYWHDCRGVQHFYVRLLADIQLPQFEELIKSACEKGYLTVVPDFEGDSLSDVITDANAVVHYSYD